MGLIIQKSTGSFHSAESGAVLTELYGRVSFSAGPSGTKIDVSVAVYTTEQAYTENYAPVSIQEKADIELQKTFPVADSTEQTTLVAHNKMKTYLESPEGGEYVVSIVGL